jgi:hypothetical protein
LSTFAHRIVGTITVFSALAAILALPGASFGTSVDGLGQQLRQTVDGTLNDVTAPVTRKPAAPKPAQSPAAAPNQVSTRGSQQDTRIYQPPAHGTNPHGQGTVFSFDVDPSDKRPLGADPAGGDDQPEDKEELVVGRSRGEQQSDGSYHGKITILALDLSNLFMDGPMIDYSVETNNGETKSGLLPAQDFFDELCSGTSNEFCLEIGQADSSTNGSGSTNSFSIASAQILGIAAILGESDGNISTDSTCQTSRGSSRLALVAFEEENIEIGRSSTESRDCNNGTSTQTNDSTAFTDPFGISQEFDDNCANGEPDRYSGDQSLGPFIAWLFCNADDTNGLGANDTPQSTAPYGVREALMAQGCFDEKSLAESFGGCLKGTVGASDSRAQRPPAPPTAGSVLPTTPVSAPQQNSDEPSSPTNPDRSDRAPEGASGSPSPGSRVSRTAVADGQLPFTGAELIGLLLAAAGLLLAGASLWRLAGARLRGPA